MATKVLNDPIHGNIELHPLLVKIIDTPEFQRLRFIKQLGGVYFVYPGASHNRFEHSIGVCHLAGRLVHALKEQKSKALKGAKITHVDELCVKIAALCHDLGHGPFSHLFDGQIIPNTPKKWSHGKYDKWTHEQGSVDMFDHMLKENEELRKEFRKEKIMKKDIEFIKEMIVGPKAENNNPVASTKKLKYENRPEAKWFLYEIVSNKRNGIDVDKWDYFARDSYMLGIGNNFNYDRCIALSRVIEVDGENQICFREKEATNLYDMFHTRLLLHQRAYQHKTVNIIELMLAEALILADNILKFEGKNGKMICMSKTIADMKAYTFLTDNVVHRIIESKSKSQKVKDSKIILKRILSRDLYKCVGEKRFPGGTFDDKGDVKRDIKETVTVSPKFKKIVDKIDKDAVIDLVKLNYGKKGEDPIASVNFYSKKTPDKAGPRKKEDVSLLLQTEFEEQLVRLYWKKKSTDFKKVQEMFNTWAKQTKKNSKKQKTRSRLTR